MLIVNTQGDGESECVQLSHKPKCIFEVEVRHAYQLVGAFRDKAISGMQDSRSKIHLQPLIEIIIMSALASAMCFDGEKDVPSERTEALNTGRHFPQFTDDSAVDTDNGYTSIHVAAPYHGKDTILEAVVDAADQ